MNLLQSGLSQIESKSQPSCHQKVHKAHSFSTQESNNAGPNGAQSSPPDRSTAPLSGNPYFTAMVVKSHVQHPYQLVIPRSFNKSLPNRILQVFLTHQGRTWEMKYCGKNTRKRLCCGWREFAIDNHLKIGDGCIFELMDDEEGLKFGVQILDGQIPFKFRQEGAGEVIILD